MRTRRYVRAALANDWENAALSQTARAERAEADLASAKALLRDLLALVETDAVWRPSRFAKDARAFLAGEDQQ